MIPPRIVIDEPVHIQKLYIREFQRVEELTGDVLVAKAAADRLLTAYKHKQVCVLEENVQVCMIAYITEMSAASVLPTNIYNSVKHFDPHPFFAVYDIGCDGVSTGQTTTRNATGTDRKYWSFVAIKEMVSKIKDAVADVIVGHGSNVKVGKVVHAFTKIIHKTLHALAVVHITDPKTIADIKSKKLDVCSVEGEVHLVRDNMKMWFVKGVHKIEKLALGNSVADKPGFSSAGIISTIQELERKYENE